MIMPGIESLTIAICPRLTETQVQRLAGADPRIKVLWQPDLYAPPRFEDDPDDDPGWHRTPAQQARYDAMCDAADALFDLPDGRPAGLRRCVEANPRLRWVHTKAAGGGAAIRAANLSSGDLARLTVTTSAGVHAGELAEFALYGVLAGAKRLPAMQQRQRDHLWDDEATVQHISDMTVAIIGMGHIGRQVARYLMPLGAQIIGVNRTTRQVPGVEMHLDDDLIEVATRADAIINCLPSAIGTDQLISAEVLSAAPPGLTVVSLGRGSCIDEPALIAGLRSGQIGFAALDVVTQEPLPTDSPLWDMPNVLISPHNMSHSPHLNDRIVDLVAANAQALLDGLPLQNVMNKELFY